MKHLTPAECVFPNPVSSFLFSLRFELKKYTNMIFFATILGRSEKQFRLMLAFWQSVLVQAFFRLFFFFFFSLAATAKAGNAGAKPNLLFSFFLVLAFFLSFARPTPFLFLVLTFIPTLEEDEDACISIRLKLLTKTMKLSLPFCSVIFCHRELSFASSLQSACCNFVKTSPPPRTHTHAHTHSVLLHKCVFFPLILFAFPFSHICSNFFVVSLTKLFFFLSLA